MYCSLCGHKTDDICYLTIGVVHPTVVLCSVECTELLLNTLSAALDNVGILPLNNSRIED